jgi:hypothetical protein
VDSDDLVIRPLVRAELDVLVDWAAAEGWNPGLHDADAFWATDPEGFLGVERDGELVGGGSIVAYSREFGFAGFYLVRPGLRSHGIGARLWEAGMPRLLSRLGPGAPVGMDGVVAMQPFYARGGFAMAHRDVRFAFPARARGEDRNVVPAGDLPFAEVADFDAAHFPARREAFLRRWIAPPEGRALAWREDGRIAGLGVIRRCREGHKVGPLFAETPDVAEGLLAALVAGVPGSTAFLDVPESNPAALVLAGRWGMREVFACGRMYRGGPPRIPHERIFGITTFELG